MEEVEKLPVNVKKSLESQNRIRKKSGLRLLSVKIRKCLKCNTSFESIDKRVCYSCNEKNSEVYMD